MRIGLLGGSFDPVHRAHVELAKSALAKLNLDQVQLLPAKQPWQKPELAASATHRLDMIRLAIEHVPGLVINDIELNRPGKTYTIDTLQALPPEHDYFWILGSDQLQNLPSWHQWQDIVRRVTLVAAQRPGSQLAIGAELQTLIEAGLARAQQLDFEQMDVSSTALRQALQHNQPTGLWLDPAVANYIEQHGLYGSRSPAT